MQEIDRMLHHRTRARFWNWGLPVRYRFGQDYTGTTPRPGRAITCSESPGPVAPPSARAHFTLSARALASSSSVYGNEDRMRNGFKRLKTRSRLNEES